ncbi:unnamed protein product [Sphagnum jensenii]|uniref:ABC transporter domain-containing protein n=1 Tax=Sphagnum jensenii TaxID=128206 RepID=A0ABP0XJT6_9BRYO
MEEKEENFVLPSMVQGKQQLQAMLHRQWLFKRRGWEQTTMEIISPLLMMLLLIWGWSLSMEDHFKDQVFVDTTIPILASFKNQFSLNSKSNNFLQLCPPSSKLTHHQVEEEEETTTKSTQQQMMTSKINNTSSASLPLQWHFKAFSPLFLALSLSCIDSTTKMSATIHAFNNYFGPLLVPTFDEFVQVHKLVKSTLMKANNGKQYKEALEIQQKYGNLLGNLIELGRITFAPNSTEVVALVDHLMTSTKFFKEVYGGTFLSEEEAVRDALTIANVDNPIWAIVVVNHLDLFNGKIEYKIRMNFTTTPPTTDTIHRRRKGVLTYYKQYYTSGFLSLQDVINTYIFSLVPNPSEATTALYEKPMWSAPFPTPAYIRNRYYETVGPILGLMMCLTTLYPLGMFVKALVEEKENRAKETMLIMGLKPWVFTMSWLITYLVVFFLISLMVTALLSFTVFPRSDPSILFLLFFLFTLSLIPFGFFLSVFFSKAKLAAIVAPFVHFTAILPRYIFFQTSHAQAILGKSATSLLPPSAYTFGVDLVALYEGAGYGLRWVNIMEDAFSMAWILFLLLVDSIVYAGLAWYLEQVLPSEYGAVQPPWFLFAPSYWQGGVLGVAAGPSASYERLSDSIPGDEMVTMVQEEIEEPYLSTDGQLPAVRIEKLRKVFVGGKIAVDELTLDLFEGHITALLGHNGAGKSTTMSMLTGLIRPTSGDAKIWGHSIQDNMQNIRRIIGVCPQQNVLFGYLTVKEHLELYASLKGVPKLQTEQTVNEMVINLGLEDKANSRASCLSGGMQRKLQVGLAMIGGSRVVFLDEPTSGLDPQSRRSIWELLHSFKSQRAIVLTTHYMDEADLLCDRIAIMSKGHLQCCGSSLFLKVLLTVSQVSLSFPHAGARGGGGLTFQLPLSNKGEFAQLFHELETRLEELHIGNYGISMTTMEDVFLRLSNKDHHDFNVRNERKRVEGGLAGEDTVIIQELRKVHPGGGLEKDHLAVKGLSLGIPPGECFGFLGVNGAGKTTTLSILSGDLAPTSGDVFINGYSIISERSAARKQMGYCPQFNPLLDLMTAREHLHMYASLKGVPADKVEDVVSDLLQATGLQENADQITQSYSGGNKRKLALAIAMVGDPAVVFLDEPSSGMDPLTRRAMWNLITNAVIKKNMSVVLTTHNMEECEALCNRIGIMVAGSLVCLGSIQQIKSCFGSGYTVELRCKSPKSLQSLHQFMILKFPESTLEEQHMTRVKYHLPKKAFSLSKAFCALEREKDRLGIEDYSISQNTLEQIFLSLANGHNGDLTDNQ